MDTVAEKLLANSLAAILSSIEIYNKPDFKYREEIFTILNINAWELLLKTKILTDNNGIISSLYVMKEEGVPKLTEVNPRMGGGTIMATYAGVNFPELIIKIVNDEP